MSAPFTPTANCLSAKARHGSEEAARAAARQGMLAGAPKLSAYSCLLCMGWHLTSSAPRAKTIKRKR